MPPISAPASDCWRCTISPKATVPPGRRTHRSPPANRDLITHHPQPNPGIAKPQGISVLEPSEGCLLYPSHLFQPEFQPAATCQGGVQRARSGGLQGLGKVRVAEDGA